MSRETFWLNLKALAAYLDGDRELSEVTLDALEHELKAMNPESQQNVSTDLTLVIAQLARLKMRMQEWR
jgi:hypothetical protein